MTSANQKSAQMLAAAADLLDQGQIASRLSTALTAIAGAALMLPIFPGADVLAPIAALVAVTGLAELALAMRVGFNAALFRRLAADAAADRLDRDASDAGLAALRLMPAGKAGRPIAARFLGARRLLWAQVITLLVQVALAIAGGAYTLLQAS